MNVKIILVLLLIIGSVSFVAAQETLDILTVSGHFGKPQPFEAESPYKGETTEIG
jgi:hypothetical protein